MVAVATLALIGTVSASAQGGFRWGLMGGANFSKFSTTISDYQSDLFTAFHIGPMVELELPILPVAIEAGVLYSQKGVTMEQAGNEILKFKSNLVEIPLNLKGYIFSIPAVRFFVIAGPSFNFALNTSVGDIKVKEITDVKANRIGVNLNAGIGVEVLKSLQISATYNAAMTDSYKFENAGKVVNDFLNEKEKGFSVTARLLF